MTTILNERRGPLVMATLSTALALCCVALTRPVEARTSRAKAEIVEMEDGTRAKVALATLKNDRRSRSLGDDEGKGGDGAGCGQVDIGNDTSDRRGANRIAERDKVVIVTGDVYNTASCKR